VLLFTRICCYCPALTLRLRCCCFAPHTACTGCWLRFTFTLRFTRYVALLLLLLLLVGYRFCCFGCYAHTFVARLRLDVLRLVPGLHGCLRLPRLLPSAFTGCVYTHVATPHVPHTFGCTLLRFCCYRTPLPTRLVTLPLPHTLDALLTLFLRCFVGYVYVVVGSCHTYVGCVYTLGLHVRLLRLRFGLVTRFVGWFTLPQLPFTSHGCTLRCNVRCYPTFTFTLGWFAFTRTHVLRSWLRFTVTDTYVTRCYAWLFTHTVAVGLRLHTFTLLVGYVTFVVTVVTFGCCSRLLVWLPRCTCGLRVTRTLFPFFVTLPRWLRLHLVVVVAGYGCYVVVALPRWLRWITVTITFTVGWLRVYVTRLRICCAFGFVIVVVVGDCC